MRNDIGYSQRLEWSAIPDELGRDISIRVPVAAKMTASAFRVNAQGRQAEDLGKDANEYEAGLYKSRETLDSIKQIENPFVFLSTYVGSNPYLCMIDIDLNKVYKPFQMDTMKRLEKMQQVPLYRSLTAINMRPWELFSKFPEIFSDMRSLNAAFVSSNLSTCSLETCALFREANYKSLSKDTYHLLALNNDMIAVNQQGIDTAVLAHLERIFKLKTYLGLRERSMHEARFTADENDFAEIELVRV